MKQENAYKDKSAGKLIKEISRMAHIYFQMEFKKYSIGHAQIPTLIFIAKNDGVSQHELSGYLKIDKSSVTSQISILEKHGYIERKRSKEDARVHKISITEKTRNIMGPLKIVFSSWTEILFDGFSEKEKEAAYDILVRMRDNAGNRLYEMKKLKCAK